VHRKNTERPPGDRAAWWEGRRAELIELAREAGAVAVINEELLNEAGFDLLCLESVDEILHPLGWLPHPRVVEAMGRLGAGFLCRSPGEAAAAREALQGRPVGRVLLTADPGPDWALPLATVTLALGLDGSDPESPALAIRDVLLTLPGPEAVDEDLAPRVAALRRAGARIRGLYLPWQDVEDLSALQRLRHSGWVSAVALGREAGFPRLDGERTEEQLAAIRRALGGPQVWIVPGARFYAAMTALLIPVDQVEQQGSRTAVDLPGRWVVPISETLARGEAQLVNLTAPRPGPPGPVQLRVTGEDDARLTCASGIDGEPGPEDVLLLWPFAAAPEATRYLNARRICQVPL
jgi:hypothetical protein